MPKLSKHPVFPAQGILTYIVLTNGITKQRSYANEIVKMMAKRPKVSGNDDADAT